MSFLQFFPTEAQIQIVFLLSRLFRSEKYQTQGDLELLANVCINKKSGRLEVGADHHEQQN